MTNVISDAILGLSLTKFLLHLLNFAILFVALWLILYKPVMKFIRERQERIAKAQQDAADAQAAADAARAEEEERLRTLDVEIEERRAAAEREIAQESAARIGEAETRAAEIVADAERRANEEADRVIGEAREGIRDAAVALAESIIEERIDEVDDALIDSALKEWKND